MAGTQVRIADLNPFCERWFIKGVVTYKSTIREWNKYNSRGEYIFFRLKDISGDIRVVAYNMECRHVDRIIKKDKSYVIANGDVKKAEKNDIYYQPDHEYEINITPKTSIKRLRSFDISGGTYNFVPFVALNRMGENMRADIIGVCTNVSALQQREDDEAIHRERRVILSDQHYNEITLRVRDYLTLDFDNAARQIFVVQAARSMQARGEHFFDVGNGSTLQINPDIPEVHAFRMALSDPSER